MAQIIEVNATACVWTSQFWRLSSRARAGKIFPRLQMLDVMLKSNGPKKGGNLWIVKAGSSSSGSQHLRRLRKTQFAQIRKKSKCFCTFTSVDAKIGYPTTKSPLLLDLYSKYQEPRHTLVLMLFLKEALSIFSTD